ncbi:NUDIX hydrolase [Phenylobacterium sp. VNQ135]|uniref:NUDIX hydrolase n=1 Tax=Phenylobacterium sp. VNQ135 TaxID=3400922 RepID=UPI003BFADCAA
MNGLPERPTARVVLLDRQDRILLMKGRLPSRPQGEGAWFTVGGGVEPGETMAEAAIREIREETGILDFDLGPVLWRREGVMRLPTPTLLRECYFLARCEGAEPDRAGWNALERELIDDIRWWRRQELLTTPDRVFPPGLAHLLEDVIAGRLPAEPAVLPWM